MPAIMLALANGAASTATQAAETVQALRYGASLFHFYQQQYFDALTELMVGQELDDLAAHTQGAELLRGGMALSYGMDNVAESVFTQQLRDANDLVDRDRAWFYLGKMAWQRGDVPRAARALEQISKDYDGDLAQEAAYLNATTRLYLGDNTEAQRQATELPKKSKWRYYLNYNLGATEAAGENWGNATAYFDELGGMSLRSPEALALQDKGFTAAGFSFLAAGDFEQAQEAFRQVRLESPLSNRAMLGYGWSFIEQDNYQGALTPWHTLAQRSMLDASARESLLALPYAYGQLGKPGIALAKYQTAAETYTEEREGVEKAIVAFSEQPLGPLFGIEPDDSGDWFFDVDVLPSGEHAPYLQYLITRHDFQVALRELRDLQRIANRLQRAEERLQVLQQVDTHQQQVWHDLARQGRRNQLAQRQSELSQDITSLRKKTAAAIARDDGLLLIDATETAQWAQLERAEALAARIDIQGKHSSTLRLLRGVLLWQANEQYPTRAWQAQQQLQELEDLENESGIALRRVDTAIAERQTSDFTPRIAALEQRVRAQSAQVAQTIAVSESGLRTLAVTELQHQAEQLTRALGQSKLAIAQLHDQGVGVAP